MSLLAEIFRQCPCKVPAHICKPAARVGCTGGSVVWGGTGIMTDRVQTAGGVSGHRLPCSHWGQLDSPICCSSLPPSRGARFGELQSRALRFQVPRGSFPRTEQPSARTFQRPCGSALRPRRQGGQGPLYLPAFTFSVHASPLLVTVGQCSAVDR